MKESQWEHLVTYDDGSNLERTFKYWEQRGWQLCAAIRYDDRKLRLMFKRSTDVPARGEGDEAFVDLIEHHKQHHKQQNLEDLLSIRSRAEKELERIGPGGAVWQALRYVLGINGT